PEERAPRRAASAAPPQPNSHVDGAVRPAFAANAAATPPGAATPGAERPWAGATGDNSTAPAGASQPTPWSGITTAAGTRNASDSALAQSRPDSRYGASPAPVQNAFGTHI